MLKWYLINMRDIVEMATKFSSISFCDYYQALSGTITGLSPFCRIERNTLCKYRCNLRLDANFVCIYVQGGFAMCW